MRGDSLQVAPTRLVLYRNTPFGVDAWHSVGSLARYNGRFHRRGDPLPLYAADSLVTALVDYWEGSLNLLNRAFGADEMLAQPSG